MIILASHLGFKKKALCVLSIRPMLTACWSFISHIHFALLLQDPPRSGPCPASLIALLSIRISLIN